MKQKIIYIDDEKANLYLFNINFRRYYEVYTCESPVEALKVIEDEGIQVILTDYKMPKINGLQLIEKIKEIKPNTVCMIISGYLESDVITDKSIVFKYIMKPYKREKVIELIEQAFSMVN